MKGIQSERSYKFHSGPDFVEVDDRLGRITPGFEQEEKHYHHEWAQSSILTIDEFYQEIMPDIQKLLADKKVHGYISEITEQAAQVQKPYNKNYVKGDK